MLRTRVRWGLVLLFLILLPVSILTFQSVQSLQDERASVLEEQQVLAALLQDELDRLLGQLTQDLTYADPRSIDLRVWESFPEVDEPFLLGADGSLLYPALLPLGLSEPRPAFARALAHAEGLEYASHDRAAAQEAYWAAWKEARTAQESAEARNALGRCAVEGGDLETALEVHRRLTPYGLTLDADGAHPLTLSYLRLAGHLPAAPAASLLGEWAEGVRDGRYPLYPGIEAACRQGRVLMERWAAQGEPAAELAGTLEQIEQRARFAGEWAGLLARGIGRTAGYWSGSHGERTLLLYARPLGDGRVAGLALDVERLRQTLARSRAGNRCAERGFEFALFDADQAPLFGAQHGDTMTTVALASRGAERLRLGLWAADAASALSYYRKRNLGILTGIFVLAAFVAVGAFVIIRDMSRELRLARLRSDFVSNVTHELRTPLTAIRMNAETLLAGRYRGEEKHDEFLRTVVNESDRLDIMLPGLNGYDVCRQLRREGRTVPIIVLTARGEEADKVRGLDLGADDYVTKPVGILELMARIKAVLRRAAPSQTRPAPEEVLILGRARIDFGRHEATVGGQPVHLSPKEYGVLRLLWQRCGRVVTRTEILQQVWGYDVYPTTRTVDTHIADLRAQLEEDPAHPRYILTVHGTGYRLSL
ncbi:MAG: winged helix-turn-helix domain-containing protein [Candidatus Latescibacterota bacterium]